MKEVRAENYALESLIQEEEEEEDYDRLSFCSYLRMEENNSASTQNSRRTSSDHLFEFLISNPRPDAGNDVIFCGKTIHEEEDDDQPMNEYQKRDYFATIKSKSFRGSSFYDHDAADERRRVSSSTRFSGDLTKSKCSPGNMDYHAQRVNITSLTSMSAKSRRRMFMFGPVKFRPEMEMSAIKKRLQVRRAAPAEKVAAASGGGTKWGLLRSSLRGRSHLTSVLARSLGCIPVAAGGGGGERWLGVAN